MSFLGFIYLLLPPVLSILLIMAGIVIFKQNKLLEQNEVKKEKV